ncbi:DUF6882 domain-containing protein [Actinophytocola oryzae]|uniref:DUF6882 domain-containing protein n=1 Tax=Actinophytocola oryzae TaxID=502181 RepID=UPI0010636382|nr:DUF6882 domain-containing protein [Actinophytocola oryzae]
MPTFFELQDDAALLSFEHQLHLSETIGEHAWETDLAEPRFSFTGSHPLTCTRVHLLGSAAPGPKSWLWAWANPSGYRDEIIELALAVRAFGEEHNVPELSQAEIPFDAMPGSPTDPAHVTALMMEATKAVTKQWTGYQGPVGGGTRAGFLIEHPEFVLPAPAGPRVSRVLQQGLADLHLYDHRRAFHAYAVNRGLGAQHNGPQMYISGPGFSVSVQFNPQNLVTAMSVNMGQQ